MNRTPPRSLSGRKLTNEELDDADELRWYKPKEVRPKLRSECINNGVRPCPFVSCAHHLFLDVRKVQRVVRSRKIPREAVDTIRINFPVFSPLDLEFSCSLDEVREFPDGMTLEEMGQRMNLTRERVRQLEVAVLEKIRCTIDANPEKYRELAEAWQVALERVPYEGFDL